MFSKGLTVCFFVWFSFSASQLVFAVGMLLLVHMFANAYPKHNLNVYIKLVLGLTEVQHILEVNIIIHYIVCLGKIIW